jgi:eukaryotic-like serine/threonine-protein kinase
VLLADDGPRVIDFGISRAAEATMLTQSGAVIGSPGFMSPEQAAADEVGPPSDVFSLGAVLTFAATGAGPFGTGSIASMIYRVVHIAPDTANLPARIRPVIERCLAKDPRQRPTPGDLLAELGAGELAADWLPPRLTEVVSRYASPGLAAAASLGTGSPLPAGIPGDAPPPAGISVGRPATTAVSTPRPPGQPGAPTQPGTAVDASGTAASGIGIGTAGPSQRRSRRRLAWVAGAAAVIVAASASTALAVSSHGGQRRGTTAPSQGPSASAPASAHPTRSSSPTVSPTAASTSFAQSQPTAGQYSPTPTPTATPTTSPTPTATSTPTPTPTSSPTPTTPASLPTSSPTP